MEEAREYADRLKVAVTYKNKSMDTVCEKNYSFAEYTSLLCLEIKRIILDVEDLVYRLQDGKQKGEWEEVAIVGFSRIRHKLLDRAGEINRLPQSITIDGDGQNSTDAAADGEDVTDGVASFMRQIFNS